MAGIASEIARGGVVSSGLGIGRVSSPCSGALEIDFLLHPLDHDVGPGFSILEDSVVVLAFLFVNIAEVEMRFLIVWLELESSKENGFRVVQIAHFEAHEPQVEVKGIGLGVELDELAIDGVGLLEFVLLEIGEAEEIQNRVVVRRRRRASSS